MKKICVLLLLLVSFLNIKAQTAKDFVGKWKYKTFQGAEEMDSIGKAMMDEFIGGTTYFFQEDGKYRVESPLKNYEGEWRFDSDSKKIITENYVGFGEILEIKEFNENQILFGGDEIEIYFQKVSSENEPRVLEINIEEDLVSVKEKQIQKKWFNLYSEKPGDTERKIEISKMLSKGAYYQFNRSGKGNKVALGIENDFDWRLNNERNKLYLEFEEQILIWHIIKYTKTELVLLKGITGEKWFFSTNEPKQN